MAYELKKEADIQNLGSISYVAAPFDQSMDIFKEKGLTLISARDLAYARIRDAESNGVKNSSLCQNGSWIKEGVLYVPNGKNNLFLLRDSLVLKNPAEATDAHRNSKEYKISEKAVKKHVKESGKKNVLALKSLDAVPTNRFGEDGLTLWLFDDIAGEYGKLLSDSGIKAMPLYFDNADQVVKQGQSYANQLWLGGFGNSSILVGRYWDLLMDNWARGVHASASPRSGRAQEKPESLYTPKHMKILETALHTEGISGDLEKRIKAHLK